MVSFIKSKLLQRFKSDSLIGLIFSGNLSIFAGSVATIVAVEPQPVIANAINEAI